MTTCFAARSDRWRPKLRAAGGVVGAIGAAGWSEGIVGVGRAGVGEPVAAIGAELTNVNTIAAISSRLGYLASVR